MEWDFEVDGNKPAKDFVASEREKILNTGVVWEKVLEISLPNDLQWKDSSGSLWWNILCAWCELINYKNFKVNENQWKNVGNPALRSSFV